MPYSKVRGTCLYRPCRNQAPAQEPAPEAEPERNVPRCAIDGTGQRRDNATFATAVRMFPDDPVANLNAANTALRLGDLKGAETYLGKAEMLPKPFYARGIHAALLKDYDAAQPLLKQALQQGVAQAERRVATDRPHKTRTGGRRGIKERKQQKHNTRI